MGSQACLLVRRSLEQQVKDLGQQVAVLVNQVHSLQGNIAPSRLRPGTPSSSSGVVTADDIISDRLVSFHDIQVVFLFPQWLSQICLFAEIVKACIQGAQRTSPHACRVCSRGTWSF